MKISVVIPAYNEEKYLPDTLKSLKNLTRKPDEVVVADAQSQDATPEIARKSGAKIIPTEHRTIGFSRQKALEAATGDVVAFTDADTVVPPDWLTVIEQKLQQPKVVGVFGGFRVPDGPAWYKFYINHIQPALSLFLFLFGIPMATGQNMAFWKDKALQAGGFPEDFKLAEDIEIARRLMTKGEIVFDPYFTVCASGRRGYEGPGLFTRIPKAFIYYFLFRKADKIGFPDLR